MPERFSILILILIPLLFSCSAGKPPDELFHDNINKMVLLDRAMGFTEDVSRVSIINKKVYEDKVEVEVKVEGWAIHREVTIGATLPAAKKKQPSWAVWKFFCRKIDKKWVILEKYKVAEGFIEQEPG